MDEELHPDSLSWTATHTEGNERAFQMAQQLEDRPVIDVNGEHLGHITKCFVDRGRLDRCQLTLDAVARDLFRAEQPTVDIAPDIVAHVDEEAVHLRKAGEEIVHPEDPRPMRADKGATGSDDLPRKVR